MRTFFVFCFLFSSFSLLGQGSITQGNVDSLTRAIDQDKGWTKDFYNPSTGWHTCAGEVAGKLLGLPPQRAITLMDSLARYGETYEAFGKALGVSAGPDGECQSSVPTNPKKDSVVAVGYYRGFFWELRVECRNLFISETPENITAAKQILEEIDSSVISGGVIHIPGTTYYVSRDTIRERLVYITEEEHFVTVKKTVTQVDSGEAGRYSNRPWQPFEPGVAGSITIEDLEKRVVSRTIVIETKKGVGAGGGFIIGALAATLGNIIIRGVLPDAGPAPTSAPPRPYRPGWPQIGQ